MVIVRILSRKKLKKHEKSETFSKIGRKSDVFYGIIDYTDRNM